MNADAQSYDKGDSGAGVIGVHRRSSAVSNDTGEAGDDGATGSAPWHLYVVECRDGSFYVGIAKDVARRIAAHNSGRGARYTATRTPVRLVHAEGCCDVGSALRREREVKRWSRPQKMEKLGLEGPPRLRGRRCA